MKLKLLLISIIFLVIVSAAEPFTCYQSDYQKFLKHYQRNVEVEKLKPDYNKRFETFCNNKEHILAVNSQQTDYQLNDQWQWMDMYQEEINEFVRVQLTPDQIFAQVQQTDDNQLRKVSATPPTSINYRDLGKVSSIKSQGSCGCCWSFTTVGLYESWMMLKGEAEYDLSEEYILECTNKFTTNIKNYNYSSTCNGGYVDFAGELAQVTGIPLESTFPYLGKNYTGSTFPTTYNICAANETIAYGGNPNLTTFGGSRNSSNDKMKQLIANGPVGALIYADTGFMAYKSGIYSGCPSFATSVSKINHAVIIIGYDSNGNYIIKNSWGTSWGDNGFGIVSKDADCGLSAWSYYYTSNAAPGANLVYANKFDLETKVSPNSEYFLVPTFILMLIMVLMN